MTTTPAPILTPAKRRIFMVITLALPFVALAVLEIVLRLFGWGGYPPFIRPVGALPSGERVCIVEPAASTPYFFANPTRPGFAEQSDFLMPKPKNTLRIFVIGESAAKGYPQPRNLSMGQFLQAMLTDALPGKRVEVINMGTTAVASFPLVYQVRDALRYDPDWFVFYVGNNEFFGAYGTASINAAGTLPPWALKWMRSARGLALVQAIEGLVRSGADKDRTLMEQMIGQTFIACDSPLREAAARNLRENLGHMLDQVKAAGVSALVCTTASNESGLAPLGEDDVSDLSSAQQTELDALVRQAGECPNGDPACAVELLRKAAAIAPRSAKTQFRLANALSNAGDASEARKAYLLARDLDTMPWRPISQTEQAIRDAATERGVALCDVAQLFRDMSPAGATGWKLLDDHVHPSLQGQAQVAAAMARMLAPSNTAEPSMAADWSAYARRLGSNPLDTYRVNHTLRTLFGIGFMRKNNKQAFDRYENACKQFESTLTPNLLEVAREFQSSNPHAGGMRPLTGMIARVLLRENKTEQALALYQIAQTQVPNYTSWKLEYIYFTLACQERIAQQKLKDAATTSARGNAAAATEIAPPSSVSSPTATPATLLTDTQLHQAADAIAEGTFLLREGFSDSGFTERYVGRLHQLRGEWSQAIPYLQAARPRMSAEDLVACDQALFMSFVKTGDTAAALRLANEGLEKSGRFASVYQQLRGQLGQR